MIDDPTSCLREQHINSLITHTTDGGERLGHVGDLVPRAILVTSLRIHRHCLFLPCGKSVLNGMPQSPPMECSSQCPLGPHSRLIRSPQSRSISSSQSHSHDELPCCLHLTPQGTKLDEHFVSMDQTLVGDRNRLSQGLQCIHPLVHHCVVDTEPLTCALKHTTQESSIGSHEQNPLTAKFCWVFLSTCVWVQRIPRDLCSN